MMMFPRRVVALLTLALGVAAPSVMASDIARGRALVEATNCAACHGATMNDPVDDRYPKLAGQYADYLYFAMRQYQIGTEHPLIGRDDDVMRTQLQAMSEANLRDIAAYLAALPGDLVQKR